MLAVEKIGSMKILITLFGDDQINYLITELEFE